MRRTTTHLMTIAALVAVVGSFGAPTLAGGCFSAAAPEAVVLPDGELYPAGKITVCPVRTLTPVATLHRLSIDGIDVGFFMGTRAAIAGDVEGRPTLVFGRRDLGEALRLHAVVYGTGGDLQAFRADRIGRGRLPEVRTEEAISRSPLTAL